MRDGWGTVFSVGPVLITILIAFIIFGAAFGGFAYAQRAPRPAIQSVLISADGSSCSLNFTNPGNADAKLSDIFISTPGSSPAVSFPGQTTIRHGHVTDYDCALGSPSQFVPSFNGQRGQRFNLTARFDDGSSVNATSEFS